MKQYLLSVHMIDGSPEIPAEAMQKMYADVNAVNQEMQQKGAWVFGGGLHTPDMATVVEVKGGEVLTTDGPFSEAKEHIGGFWVIQAEDLDGALAWAEKCTKACTKPVEVRPFNNAIES